MYRTTELTNFQILQRDHNTDSVTLQTSNNDHLTLKTGGPYTIDDKHDIYVGDIWVMAGQSNMRGHGYLQDPFQTTSSTPQQHSLHLFDSTETWRELSDPTHQLYLSPRKVHHTLPDPTVKYPTMTKYRGASLGPSFGAHYEPNVPVGLISSAHGGVSLNDWKRPSELNEVTYDTTLYGAMIDRIRKTGNQITGILWYQGESDTSNKTDAESYGTRFQQWIQDVRNDTRSNLPIIFVQLASHRVDVPETIENWKIVQEEQRKLMDIDPLLTGVASIDCSLDDRLHLSKEGLDVLGKRLSKAACLTLKNAYKTPLPKTATYQNKIHVPGVVEVHSILLEFNLPLNFEFESKDIDILGFELDHNESKVAILRTRIEKDKKSIRMYLSHRPKVGLTITYGMNSVTNLNKHADIILPAFKDWSVINIF